MEITFLGTGFEIPTRRRNHSAVLLTHEGENILIDCGEGTQRQFRKARLNPCKITRLFITHWHGDHVLGIPALLQTLSSSGYNKTLHIYGPKETKQRINAMLNMFLYHGGVKLEIHEIGEGKIDLGNLEATAYKMTHAKTNCLSYSIEEKEKIRINKKKMQKLGLKRPIVGELQKGKDVKFNGKIIKSKDLTYLQKGKKLAFIWDTSPNLNCIKAAKNADFLATECNFLEQDKAKAKEYGHLTAAQAATIAKKAKAKVLYLTHISQRYEKDESVITKEARKIFKNTHLASDLLKITI